MWRKGNILIFEKAINRSTYHKDYEINIFIKNN